MQLQKVSDRDSTADRTPLLLSQPDIDAAGAELVGALQGFESEPSFELFHAHKTGSFLGSALIPELATNTVDFTLRVAS